LGTIGAVTDKDRLQQALDTALGPHLGAAAGVVGKPRVNHILGGSGEKGWSRNPSSKEILVVNQDSGLMHAPQCGTVRTKLEDVLGQLQEQGAAVTWCGWTFAQASVASLMLWESKKTVVESYLCKRCFGEGTSYLSNSDSGSD